MLALAVTATICSTDAPLSFQISTLVRQVFPFRRQRL
jgi:hypothetical protein